MLKNKQLKPNIDLKSFFYKLIAVKYKPMAILFANLITSQMC